jgi:hypothetical protein
LIERLSARVACRTMVDILALAHDRACEGELADRLASDLDQDRLPDMRILRALFMPDAERIPDVIVVSTPLSIYDELSPAHQETAA